jgi:hypothetical protein
MLLSQIRGPLLYELTPISWTVYLGGLEKAQALRSLLIPTSDSSPAMMPSSHRGLALQHFRACSS